MTPLDPRLSQAASSLAADSRSLDALKREAQRDPQAAVKQAARQFEALFMQMVLKSMRDAMPKSGMFDSPAHDMYTGMLDQQMATKMAASGTGLADVIARQLTRHIQPPATAGTEAAASAPAAMPGAPARSTSAAREAAARYAAIAQATERSATSAPATDQSATPSAAPHAALPTADARLPTQARRDFITRHWDSALAAQRATGIPAQFVLSQAALESGWGRAEIRGADGMPSHNLFGIKATGGWQGRTVDVVTTEYENGVPKKVVDRFRAYNNYSEAFRDWAQLLAGNPRYAGVIAQGRSAEGFAQGLQRAGYATDPAYAAKLTRVIASVSSALGAS